MKNKAFTLIEVLIVILVIGIIASIALPQYQKIMDKTKYSEKAWNIRTIYNALERYYLTTGEYPPASLENLSDPSSLSSALDMDIPPHPYPWYLYYRPSHRYVGYYNTGTQIWLQCALQPSTSGCTCSIPSANVTAKKVALCQALCKNPKAYSGSGGYTCSL